MKVISSAPLPIVEKTRSVMQRFNRDDLVLRMAPIDWLPESAQPTVQYLLNEIDFLKSQLKLPISDSVTIGPK